MVFLTIEIIIPERATKRFRLNPVYLSRINQNTQNILVTKTLGQDYPISA